MNYGSGLSCEIGRRSLMPQRMPLTINPIEPIAVQKPAIKHRTPTSAIIPPQPMSEAITPMV